MSFALERSGVQLTRSLDNEQRMMNYEVRPSSIRNPCSTFDILI
jgi:hypothetical protein